MEPIKSTATPNPVATPAATAAPAAPEAAPAAEVKPAITVTTAPATGTDTVAIAPAATERAAAKRGGVADLLRGYAGAAVEAHRDGVAAGWGNGEVLAASTGNGEVRAASAAASPDRPGGSPAIDELNAAKARFDAAKLAVQNVERELNQVADRYGAGLTKAQADAYAERHKIRHLELYRELAEAERQLAGTLKRHEVEFAARFTDTDSLANHELIGKSYREIAGTPQAAVAVSFGERLSESPNRERLQELEAKGIGLDFLSLLQETALDNAAAAAVGSDPEHPDPLADLYASAARTARNYALSGEKAIKDAQKFQKSADAFGKVAEALSFRSPDPVGELKRLYDKGATEGDRTRNLAILGLALLPVRAKQGYDIEKYDAVLKEVLTGAKDGVELWFRLVGWAGKAAGSSASAAERLAVTGGPLVGALGYAIGAAGKLYRGQYLGAAADALAAIGHGITPFNPLGGAVLSAIGVAGSIAADYVDHPLDTTQRAHVRATLGQIGVPHPLIDELDGSGGRRIARLRTGGLDLSVEEIQSLANAGVLPAAVDQSLVNFGNLRRRFGGFDPARVLDAIGRAGGDDRGRARLAKDLEDLSHHLFDVLPATRSQEDLRAKLREIIAGSSPRDQRFRQAAELLLAELERRQEP